MAIEFCSNCGTKITRANTKLDIGISFSTGKPLIEICIPCGAKIREIGRVNIIK